MRGVKLQFAILLFFISLIFACSHPDPGRLMRSSDDNPDNLTQFQDSIADSSGDSSNVVADTADYDASIDKAEYFYAVGAHYFQVSQLDSAQAAYEQSLAILSELDVDPDDNPEQAARMERLLNEIEQDYHLTLVTSGKLYSESSIEAFRDLFDNLKNFKNLKGAEAVHEFNKADTVIYDINIEWNEKVENSLIYLQTVARDKFTTFLARSTKYIPLMEKIIKDEGLPHDIVYLPLIESGFNPNAFSYARASGFWQFISSTGQLYGLQHNWWYDQRRDFETATRAAARHLRDLYNMFGSWNLALAAYNSGAGRVSRDMKRSNSNDFWRLRLPAQTKNYVPLFMAATIIAKQPQKYGFFPNFENPIDWDTFTVTKCVSFNNISAKTGISVSDLELLNPELLRGITPPDATAYRLRIPKGYSDTFANAYDSIPSEQATTLAMHRVKRGESLKSIARNYSVSVAALMEANNLSKKKRIRVGQTLTVPVLLSNKSTVNANTNPKYVALNNAIVKENPDKYRVKSGDTLWEIAAAYGVSIADLKRINNLSSSNLYTGRVLRIPTANGAPSNDPPKASPPKLSFANYKVKRGDTLAKIASRNNLTLAQLKSLNNMRSNLIYPGMVLKVASATSSIAQYADQSGNSSNASVTDTYTIREGDTLWKIAKSYDVGIDDIAKWNNISNSDQLNPGDKLKIYSK
jgi:membrane-bound lytic murein transglycosylase D